MTRDQYDRLPDLERDMLRHIFFCQTDGRKATQMAVAEHCYSTDKEVVALLLKLEQDTHITSRKPFGFLRTYALSDAMLTLHQQMQKEANPVLPTILGQATE